MAAEVKELGSVDYGIAMRTLKGESVSGDAHLIKPFDDGVLLAVVDGAGHGREATVAAETAINVLEKHPEESVLHLMQLCHKELQNTRGAAMTLVSLRTDRNLLEWVGVGNVEGYCFHQAMGALPQAEGVLLRGGIVGYQLPPLRASMVSIVPGDTLILVTDGIRSEFSVNLNLRDTPQRIAEQILSRHLKGTDDGLVLVVRYLGGEHA